MFLLYYPLKQGLKHDGVHHPFGCFEFLLYYPLKQGLKQFIMVKKSKTEGVFTLLSIKTRIETLMN